MLNLSSIMVGTSQPKVMGEFYEKVIGKPSDMAEEGWYGWKFGDLYLNIGEHSEVHGESKEPQRVLFNLEAKDVKAEFERIKAIGAEVIKKPYQMSAEGEILSDTDEGGMWIATFSDPDGNYFQLMSPWEESN